MRILIHSTFTSHNFKAGGSGSYFTTLIEALGSLGHEVFCGVSHGYAERGFDVVITSHPKPFKEVERFKGFKIHICHGVFPPAEQPVPGADAYVSISEEVRQHLEAKGYESTVIRQPIEIPPPVPYRHGFAKQLEKILFIKNYASQEDFEHSLIENIDPKEPALPQIRDADMIISLGRGALEAMSYAKPVIIADTRNYIGYLGDGYLITETALESMKFNYNGKRFRNRVTPSWMREQIEKYNPEHGVHLYQHCIKYHDADMIAKQLLGLIR